MTVSGSGGLNYFSSDYWEYASNMDITGTTVADFFHSGWADDIMRGGGGNDVFQIGAGIDVAYSETNDADQFYFDFDAEGYTETYGVIKGFNGVGSLTGDKIYIYEGMLNGIPSSDFQVNYVNGNTVFNIANAISYTVEGVDLRQGEGIDWFLI
jgi:Ca2+-binding RTX toxin-like protein